MKKVLLSFVLASTLLAAPACNRYVVHPGAVSQIDSVAYDVLLTAKATIDATKTQLPLLPVAQQPAVKGVLNNAIAAYNVAEATWHLYHDTTPLSATVATALQNDLNDLNAAILALTNVKAAQ